MLAQVLFQDSEATIASTEINDTSYESQDDFHWEKTKQFFFLKNPNTKSKKLSFFISTNIQFTIMEQFLQFKTYKSGEIDAIGIEVAQQIKLSGCPTKGYFTTKSAKNAFLVVK